MTVEQLKTAFAQINNNATDGGAAKIKKELTDDAAADGNGWDDFDVDEDEEATSAAAAEMPGTRTLDAFRDCRGRHLQACTGLLFAVGVRLREYVEVSEGGWLNIHSKLEWISPKITRGLRPLVIFGDIHSRFE